MSYYFAINGKDFSKYVNKLSVGTEHFYKSMTSSGGNTVVKYTNTKKVLEVGIIPLEDNVMAQLLTEINMFKVRVSYRDPETNVMVEDLQCIIPNNIVEYYTIQVGKVQYKAFSIQINEL